MRSVRFLIAAGAASLMSSAAFAADMPIMPPPPPVYAPPPVDFGGWYLRGDIGMTNQSLKSLTNTDPNSAAFTSTGMGFDSVLIITDSVDENVYLATRNLPHVAVVEPRYADPLSLVHYKKVLITKPAIAQLEEMLG